MKEIENLQNHINKSIYQLELACQELNFAGNNVIEGIAKLDNFFNM